MASEIWSPEPYSREEVISLDRLKRAVTSRVLNRVESEAGERFPSVAEQLAEFINDEWQRAKEAVRTSPAAREAYGKYLEQDVSQRIDSLIEDDKDELRAMGVAEKSL